MGWWERRMYGNVLGIVRLLMLRVICDREGVTGGGGIGDLGM